MLYLGFLLGLLGSFHCVGMCGPIALILPLHRDNIWIKNIQILSYFVGKTLTYAVLGLIFGLIGKGLFIREYQQNFSIFVGIVMVLVGILSFFQIHFSYLQIPIFKGLSQVKSALAKQLKSKTIFSVFLIGFLNGFLPCGLVYTALFSALATADITSSILYMLCFGLGTSVLMIVFVYIGNFLSANVQKRIQKTIPFFVIIFGILLMMRGLGLDIPMISPSNTHLMIQENPDCIVPMKK